MPTHTRPGITPQRGEIWYVNFNTPVTAPTPPPGTPKSLLPTTGDEIYKERPAVVMSISQRWRLNLHIVVPLTKWRPHFRANGYFWMIELPKDRRNNLREDSAANTFQVKSVSLTRFLNRHGTVSSSQLDQIAETVAFCIGYSPPKSIVQ